MKKQWVTPKLIVLVREEDRQERVLAGCKDGGPWGPGNAYNGCQAAMSYGRWMCSLSHCSAESGS